MASEGQPTPTATQRYWLEHLHACEQAGQSLRAYAKAHGLNRYSLQSGKSQLVRLGLWPASPPSSQGEFVRVEVSRPVGDAPHRLHLGEGLVLELATHSAPSWVAQLLRALQERP